MKAPFTCCRGPVAADAHVGLELVEGPPGARQHLTLGPRGRSRSPRTASVAAPPPSRPSCAHRDLRAAWARGTGLHAVRRGPSGDIRGETTTRSGYGGCKRLRGGPRLRRPSDGSAGEGPAHPLEPLGQEDRGEPKLRRTKPCPPAPKSAPSLNATFARSRKNVKGSAAAGARAPAIEPGEVRALGRRHRDAGQMPAARSRPGSPGWPRDSAAARRATRAPSR